MNRRRFALALLSLVAVAWASVPVTSSAASMRRPAGLSPGDEYRLAFITVSRRDAASGDIDDYNAFVTAEANHADSVVAELGAEWKAIASTAAVDAIANTGADPSPAGATGVPIYHVDGTTRVAANYDDLWDGSIENTIFLAPRDGVLTEAVWTGTGADGGPSNPLGAGAPGYGIISTLGAGWVEQGAGIGADTPLSMYALSGVLVATPEPASGVSLGIGALAALGRRRR